jgi:hypothetical protein
MRLQPRRIQPPHLCGDELDQAPVSPKLPPVAVVAHCIRILLSSPLLQLLELRLALIAAAAAAISVRIQGRMHRMRLKSQSATCCRCCPRCPPAAISRRIRYTSQGRGQGGPCAHRRLAAGQRAWHTSAYVSIRQHTSAYVSIRAAGQHAG